VRKFEGMWGALKGMSMSEYTSHFNYEKKLCTTNVENVPLSFPCYHKNSSFDQIASRGGRRVSRGKKTDSPRGMA